MAKGYSRDLRERAVAMVEDGESRREVARVLDLAPSTAVRWLERWTTTGTVDAKPGTGHSRSPLKACEQWLLDLVAKEPDLTLEEIRDRLRREKKLEVVPRASPHVVRSRARSSNWNSARRPLSACNDLAAPTVQKTLTFPVLSERSTESLAPGSDRIMSRSRACQR